MDPHSTPAAMTVGAVVMAAGAGRRMGGVPKPLLRRDGEPLLLRQTRLAAAAGAGVITVVLGHHAERLAPVLDRSLACEPHRYARAHVHRVINPVPDAGTGSSLRCGLAALPATLSTCVVLLGDQPLLEIEDVKTMLAAWRERPAGIELVVPRHAGRLGHPVVFGPEVREAVTRTGDSGGVRAWRRAHPEQLWTMPVPHARYTTDVDTPADLDRLHAASGIRLTCDGIP